MSEITTTRREETSERARTLNTFRRIGYRILPGDLFSYLLHLRPAEWPIMLAHTTLGLLLATGIPPAPGLLEWKTAALGLTLWVIFLNGGTLAINSAYDDDTDDIGYLEAPPPPPRHLVAFSIGLMAIGQIGALAIGPRFAIAYAICFLMSVLYSVPPFRFKAIAGADWIINMWGFGTITPFAGWALTDRPLEPWAILVLLGFCPLFAALYPLTQIYQIEEDQERGDRTLVIMLGTERALKSAIAMTTIAFLLFASGIAIGPANSLFPSIIIPFAAWLVILIPWLKKHQRMTRDQHQKGMYDALRAWAITDIAILLILAI